MKVYTNLNGNSGITNYQIGNDYIDIEFGDSGVYRYTEQSVGSDNLAIMKSLATSGSGLNAFINKVVRYRYEERYDDFPTDPNPNGAPATPETAPPTWTLRPVKSVAYPANVDSDTLTRQALSPKQIETLETPELLTHIIGNAAFGGILDLKLLAGRTPQHLARRFDLSLQDANRLALCFEFGKRLATSHSERTQFSSPGDVASYLMPKLRYLQHEVTVCLALDTKGHITDTLMMSGDSETAQSGLGDLISHRFVFEGTLNACVFHPREIFRFAIDCNANSIIIAHNHPSGDPQPSSEDIGATKQLIEAENHIGIKVLDHIIIGDGIFVSLKEKGVI